MSNEEIYLNAVSKWLRVEKRRLKKHMGGDFILSPIPKPLNCFMETETAAVHYPEINIIQQKCDWCGQTTKVKF